MKQWSTWKVATLGAIIGTVYGLLQAVAYWRGNSDPLIVQAAGSVVGGMIGGAIVGAIAAIIRNRFVG